MKRLALRRCLSLAVLAGALIVTAGRADAGPWGYRPYRVYRPYVYRPYVYRPYAYRPYAYPYRAYYAPPVFYGPPAYGYYYGPGVSVGVGWY